MSRPLTPRERARELLGPRLTAAGADDGPALAAELVRLLDREGIVLVDEPIRPPIGSRRRRP